MEHLRLHRATHRPMPQIAVAGAAGEIGLRRGRVHEACGPGRHGFALRVAAAGTGPLVWIRAGWMAERLNPDGVCPFADPTRLIVVECGRTDDVLWCLEETLRSGAVALAVGELPDPPGLTQVRRLHLAAEAGAAVGGDAPTGLLLLPGEGGAPGVESRWHTAPDHGPGRTAWRIERRRARQAAPATWTLAEPGGLTAHAPG